MTPDAPKRAPTVELSNFNTKGQTMDINENKGNENKGNENGGSMRKAEALGILARMAERHDLAPEEVIAIQVAFRATAKRLFDRKRGLSRRFAARRAATGAATKEGGAE